MRHQATTPAPAGAGADGPAWVCAAHARHRRVTGDTLYKPCTPRADPVPRYRPPRALYPDRAMLEQSIDVALSIEDRQRQATSLTNLAPLDIDTGRPDAALPLLAEAERLDLARGDAWGVATDRVNMAAALLAAGRRVEADEVIRELGASVADHGDPDLSLDVVELGAVASSLAGDHAQAVRLAACADEQRSVNRMPLSTPDT